MIENIENGKAYNKLLELVQNQNGDFSYIVPPCDKYSAAPR